MQSKPVQMRLALALVVCFLGLAPLLAEDYHSPDNIHQNNASISIPFFRVQQSDLIKSLDLIAQAKLLVDVSADRSWAASGTDLQNAVRCLTLAFLSLPRYARLYTLATAFQIEGDNFKAVALLKASHRILPQFAPPIQALEKILDLPLMQRIGADPDTLLKGVDGSAAQLIPGEIQDDELGAHLRNLASRADVLTIMEVGSSGGAGSTAALISGVLRRANKPKIFCMEVDKQRVARLRQRWGRFPFVHIEHASSITESEYMSEAQVREFYHLGTTLTSPEERAAHAKFVETTPLSSALEAAANSRGFAAANGAPPGGIQAVKDRERLPHFDMVLLDGSDFTSAGELRRVWGSGLILLDDVMGLKNFFARRALLASAEYALVAENVSLRHGYSVFRRRA